MDVVDIETLRRILRHHSFRHFYGFVSRVVEDLDLELVARIVNRSHRLQQSIDDIQLVKERELDSDPRQLSFTEARLGLGDEIAIAPEVDHLLDAISAVDG